MKGHLYVILLALLPTIYADTNCTFTKCTDGGSELSPAQKEACGIVISVGLTKSEKCAILKQHNALRSYVAAGLETKGNPGPQPAALNMKPMRWDSQLACVAQTWTNNCNYAHDPCRKDDRFYVGQNIGVTMTTGNVTTKPSDIIQMWYDEVSKVNNSQVQSLTDVPGIGHYTQLVWAETEKLGCGKIVYQAADDYKHYYLVCNYGPGGNIMTQPIYKTQQ